MNREHDRYISPLPGSDGRYMSINIIARRARALNRERRYSQQTDDSMWDPLEIALGEYAIQKIKYDMKSNPGDENTEDFRSLDT